MEDEDIAPNTAYPVGMGRKWCQYTIFRYCTGTTLCLILTGSAVVLGAISSFSIWRAHQYIRYGRYLLHSTGAFTVLLHYEWVKP